VAVPFSASGEAPADGAVVSVTDATGTGIAIRGTAAGAGGVGGSFIGDPALLINGEIQVTGNERPAFVWLADDSTNTCGTNDRATIIDHPMANGDPDAILFVTQREDTSANVNAPPEGTFAVLYDPSNCTDGADRWVIVRTDSATSVDGMEFDVLVIKDDTTS
jgi:hypothetical protein